MQVENEKNTQAAIEEYLLYKGYTVWRLNSGVFSVPNENGTYRKIRGLEKGTPDLQIMHLDSDLNLGITEFIEVKSKKGKLNENQKKMHVKLRKMGFQVYVIRSIDEAMEIYK